MKNNNSVEIKVGIVTVISIILLIVGLSLGRGCSVTPNTQTVKFRFTNSSGIQESAPVFINGVKHGSVLTVENDNGSVLITAKIDAASLVKEDANAKISMLEITGGKKIEIFPGKSSKVFDFNKEIPGLAGADMAEMLNIVGDIGGDAKNLVRRLDSVAQAASAILNDKNFIAQLKSTVNNADRASNDLKNLLENNMNSLQTIISNMKSITVDLKTIIKKDDPKIDSLLLKFDVILADTKSTAGNANKAISNADSLVLVFKSIADNIKSNDGLVNKFIYDKEFAKRIDSTMQNLQLLINQISQYGINANVRLGGRP